MYCRYRLYSESEDRLSHVRPCFSKKGTDAFSVGGSPSSSLWCGPRDEVSNPKWNRGISPGFSHLRPKGNRWCLSVQGLRPPAGDRWGQVEKARKERRKKGGRRERRREERECKLGWASS